MMYYSLMTLANAEKEIRERNAFCIQNKIIIHAVHVPEQTKACKAVVTPPAI